MLASINPPPIGRNGIGRHVYALDPNRKVLKMTWASAARKVVAERMRAFAESHGVTARINLDGTVRVWVDWTRRLPDGGHETGTDTHDIETWASLRLLLGY